MRFPGSRNSRRRRVMYVYIYVLILVLQQHMVGAIRVFPGNAVEFSHGRSIIDLHNKTKNQEDLFKKYFGGRSTFAPITGTGPETGFENESKRRVPSCPDPLHN